MLDERVSVLEQAAAQPNLPPPRDPMIVKVDAQLAVMRRLAQETSAAHGTLAQTVDCLSQQFAELREFVDVLRSAGLHDLHSHLHLF